MRMAAMPLAHSGLLAVAVKFTGELPCEPVAGDVTVTTGVVATAGRLRVSNRETGTRGSGSRAQFTIKTSKNPSQPGVGCAGIQRQYATRLITKPSGRSLGTPDFIP